MAHLTYSHSGFDPESTSVSALESDRTLDTALRIGQAAAARTYSFTHGRGETQFAGNTQSDHQRGALYPSDRATRTTSQSTFNYSPKLNQMSGIIRSRKTEARISFQPIQEWEGCVITCGHLTFSASLVDITANRNDAGEQAEFEYSELADQDRPLVEPGALFRWIIGYERFPSGVKRRSSSLVFRRLPAWTRGDLEQASIKANELATAIHWD